MGSSKSSEKTCWNQSDCHGSNDKGYTYDDITPGSRQQLISSKDQTQRREEKESLLSHLSTSAALLTILSAFPSGWRWGIREKAEVVRREKGGVYIARVKRRGRGGVWQEEGRGEGEAGSWSWRTLVGGREGGCENRGSAWHCQPLCCVIRVSAVCVLTGWAV